MNPNIPIPTDSVHKYYAGFGLVVFIACLVASVYVQFTTNESIMKWHEETAKIEKQKVVSKVDQDRLVRMKELINVLKSDKETFLTTLFTFALIGLIVSGWGFQHWEKYIQPRMDEKLELENELLRQEIAARKSSNKQLHRTRFARR